jgi:protein kinase C substrate 80K-H
MAPRALLACAGAALLAVAAAGGGAGLRGAQPDTLTALAAGATAFSCDAGSRTLPRSRFNDDYCDCVDGTDEPGACGAAACGSPAAGSA